MGSFSALPNQDWGSLAMNPTPEAIRPPLSLGQTTSLHSELAQPQKSGSFQEAATALPRKFSHGVSHGRISVRPSLSPLHI